MIYGNVCVCVYGESVNNVNCFQLPLQDGSHATHIHLIYEHNNQDVILDLQLNDKLIPIEHFISYQLPNGDKAIKNFTKTDINLCNYQVSDSQPPLICLFYEIFNLIGENSK